MTRWATFDCYGTLIDWNGGIRWRPDRRAVARRRRRPPARALPRDRADRAAGEPDDLLPRGDAAGARGHRRGRGPRARASEQDALGRSLPDWAPFPEVPVRARELRRRGWRLAALSNTDPDLIAASLERLGVPFDEVVTAREAGSYKPAHGHWRCFAERTGATPAEHVHVAASLVPRHRAGQRAQARLGLDQPAREAAPVPRPTRELPDLGRLPETLDELRP